MRCLPADGGAVIQQKHYHNFKQFRIFDLSDHKMNSQHLVVSATVQAGVHCAQAGVARKQSTAGGDAYMGPRVCSRRCGAPRAAPC